MSVEPVLRAATPADAPFIAWGLDEASGGFFTTMLGRPAHEVLTRVAAQPRHAFSFAHVVIAESDGSAIGLCQGFGYGTPDGTAELVRAAGVRALRLGAVALAGRRLLAALDHHEPGQWYLQAIAVRPEGRGTGVGRRLLADAFDRARGSGSSELALDVDVSNTRAADLYRRVGLEVVSTSKPARLLEGASVHRMQARLEGPTP